MRPTGRSTTSSPAARPSSARAVVDEGGAAYLALVETYFRDDVDPVVATREFFADGVMLLESTGFADACPIATWRARSPTPTRSCACRRRGVPVVDGSAQRPPRPPRRRPQRSRRDRDRVVLPHRGCLPALSHHPVLGAAAGRRPPCGRHRGRGARPGRLRVAPRVTLTRWARHVGTIASAQAGCGGLLGRRPCGGWSRAGRRARRPADPSRPGADRRGRRGPVAGSTPGRVVVGRRRWSWW